VGIVGGAVGRGVLDFCFRKIIKDRLGGIRVDIGRPFRKLLYVVGGEMAGAMETGFLMD